MKTQLPPRAVSSLPFPASPFNYASKTTLDSDIKHMIFGNFSHDGMWVWLIKGTSVEVFSTVNVERYSSWSLGAHIKDCKATITAVSEFRTFNNSALRFLIAADWALTSSIICLYDVKMSKVLKAIEIPSKITSLAVISSQNGPMTERYPLSKELHYMFGIVAVGTADGHIFFIDLNLDDDNYCNELDPNTITFITQQTHNIMGKRENALIHSQHLCLPLNSDSYYRGYFQYKNQDNSPLATFRSDEASVTALKFFCNVTLLAVGFNFGGVQLWNLSHLTLQYSCPLDNVLCPVIKFAFQEPENDPKNFFYFWTVRGYEEEHPQAPTVASLYSLSYSRKEWIDNYGFLYQGFQNCCLRFEYILSTDAFSLHDNSELVSRLICCYTIQQSDILPVGRLEHEDSLHNEDWGSRLDHNLCVLAWEAWDESTENNPICYLALFDMNQWYRAQMPSRIRCSSTTFCSYLGIFSLSPVAEQASTLPLLALQLKTNTLAKFKSLSNADEFYFPSSLSFDISCLAESGIIKAEYLGCQRMILSEMASVGPVCMLEPKTLYFFCEFTGLITQRHTSNPPVAIMREDLLSIALENNLSYFISSCIQMWAKGEYAYTGCSLKFIFDWLWKRVTHVKTSIDKLCVPLFDCSGRELDHSTLRVLHHYVNQLQMIANIFHFLQNQNVPIREQGENELDQRREVTQLIATYLQVILWLYVCKLLPEYIEGEAYGENEVAFPASMLSEAYSSKRRELQKLHSTIGQTDVLIIDGLISEMGSALSNQWEKSGWNGVYPPPSFYAVLNTYLINTIPMSSKHQLMLYVLLDMAAFLSDRQSHLIEKFMKFPAVFRLNLSHAKIIHGFWLLDHQQFEEAICVLLDPMIKTLDILPWQHVRIMKAFLYQGEHKKAMKYCHIRKPPHQTPEEVKLYLTIYLANGLTVQAFQFQQKFRDQGNTEDLLNHFFLGCEQTHTLDALFQLPLTPLEEDALITFLHNSNDPKSKELLIMYFLQKNRPVEASHLNEKLNSQKLSHQRVGPRNILVNCSLLTLPKAQNQVLREIGFQFPSNAVNKRQVIPQPQPLSTFVKMKNLKAVSHSDLYSAVIDKVKEIQLNTDNNSFIESTKDRFWKTDSIPFIGTPLPQNKILDGESKEIVFATPVIRHSNLGSDREFSASPSKMSRLLDVTPFRPPESERRRSYKVMSAEVSSLLQTPPICRKTPVRRSRIIERNASQSLTPQSILKTRNESSRIHNTNVETPITAQEFTSNVGEKSDVKDNESVNQCEMTDITDHEEDSNTKQLRFKMPERRSISSMSGKWLTPGKNIFRSFHERSFVRENIITKIAEGSPPSIHHGYPSSPSSFISDNELSKLSEDSSTKHLRFSTPEKRSTNISGKWLTPTRNVVTSFQERTFVKENIVSRTLECSVRPALHDNQSTPSSFSSDSETFKSPATVDFEESVETNLHNEPLETTEQVDKDEYVLSPQFKAPENKVPSRDIESAKSASEETEKIETPDTEMEIQQSEAVTEDFKETNQIQIESLQDNSMNVEKIEKSDSHTIDDNINEKDGESLKLSDSESELGEDVKDNLVEEKVKIKLWESDVEMESEHELKDKEIKDTTIKEITPPTSPDVKAVHSPQTALKTSPKKDSSDESKATLITELQKSPYEGTRSRSRSKSQSETSEASPQARRPSSKKSSKSSSSKNKEVLESPTKPILRSARKSKKSTSQLSESKDSGEPHFTFSDPNITEEPEGIKETSVLKTPVPSFIFSPPVTRSRSRQRKNNETFTASSSILIGDTSYRQRKSERDEVSKESKCKETPASKADLSQVKKKTPGKKKSTPKASLVSTSVINLISPVVEETPKHQTGTSKTRHNMTLRKGRQTRPFGSRKFLNV